MENGPFIDDFPIKTCIYKGFSMAILNNQMVCVFFASSWRHSSVASRAPGVIVVAHENDQLRRFLEDFMACHVWHQPGFSRCIKISFVVHKYISIYNTYTVVS
jgi:hypothetical protein